MDEPFVTSFAETPDGVRLSYKVIGSGPIDLVWISGLGYPVDLFADEPGFARLAKRLSAFGRTIWYESRGIGASGGNLLDVPETQVDDLTVVLEAARCDRPVVIGWGHSGTPAVRYAATHPERSAALVLVDAYAHYVQETDYSIGPTRAELDERLALAGELWGSALTLDLLAPSRSDDDQLRQRIARYERLGVPTDIIVESTRAVCEQDVRALLPSISCPTLVVHHDEGQFVTVDAGRYLAAHIPGVQYVEVSGADQLFFVGDIDALVDPIEEFLTGSHQRGEGDVITATIVFTDIVSSTAQAARYGHRTWTRISDEHDAMVRATLARHRGREVKTIGDGFLAVFDASTRALRAATAIVAAAGAMGIEVRAGVHVGEVEIRADDVIGLPVSVAKRICDLAGPGEVFTSRAITDLAAATDIAFVDRGDYDLKGVPGAWRLFQAKP